jgi:hypothetical protein
MDAPHADGLVAPYGGRAEVRLTRNTGAVT